MENVISFELVIVFLINLAITIAFYCAIPLLIASLKKTPTTVRSYRITCFLANFLVVIIFTAINGEPSSGGYFLWTWVFSVVGANTLRKRNLIIEGNVSNPDKFIVTSDMHKFICNNCQATHTGWYNECPNCHAVGTLRKGTDEEIRKWNAPTEVSQSVDTIIEPNTPTTDVISPVSITATTIESAPAYCKNCGTTLLEDSIFCQNCGTKVNF